MTERKITIRVPKMDAWRILTIILAVILLAQLTGFLSLTSLISLSGQQVGEKAVNYINQNLVEAGSTATLVSVKDAGNIYEITTSYKSSNIIIYATKDGNYLFLQSYNMAQPTSTTQPEEFNPTKTDVPDADLYVMSFCPYGIQAEQTMKPVLDLLGTKANIKIRFIANVQGTTMDSIQSLHGANEAMEDLRQVCIMKNYDQATYWKYLMEFDANCSSLYNNAANLDVCWKAAANKFSIDTAKIESCSNSTDAINLMKADEQLTEQYGVSGSPTLIVNGATYNGARTPEAFKQAICAGFNTKPAECSQNLTSTGTAASGGCS